jgi:PAS domain S-box-containing protein
MTRPDETLDAEQPPGVTEHGQPGDPSGAIAGRSRAAVGSGSGRVEMEQASFEAALALTVETVVAMDLEGRVVYANRAAERAVGYSRDELRGLSPDDVAEVFGADPLSEEVRAEFREGRPWRGSVIGLPKDGTPFEVETVVTLVWDEQGAPIGSLAVGQDVSEQRRLEAELRQTQKMDAIGQLAGGIAHDFNNLLTAIRGYGELLASELAAEDERSRANLAEMMAATDRAARLTRGLLAFGRRQALNPQVVAPGTIVDGIVPMLRRVLSEQVELVTRTAPDEGCVKVDPGQLEQVIVNLAVNARDAMPGGGRLTIEIASVDFEMEYVPTRSEASRGPFVRLTAADTGIGMDAATRARIFEPFFTTKPPGEGVGLGLAIVYGIVQQSGGSIYVYSEPGRGTTFRIYFPRVQAETIAGKTPAAEATQSARGTETILLVEDEPAVRVLARRILAGLGYTVLDAANGAEALEVAAGHAGPIELLLTDVVMPGMQGPELAARLEALRPGISVVYSSGYAAGTSGPELDHDAVFLGKPFTASDMGSAVRRALGKANASALAGQPVRMRDLAASTGLDATTVAAVLMGEGPSVSEADRHRVLGVAHRLGYSASSVGSSPGAQVSGVIGFIGDVVASTPWAVAMIRGAQDAAATAGKLIVIINSGGDAQVEDRAIRDMLERHIDGLVYATMWHRIVRPPASLADAPAVLLDCAAVDGRISSVVPDEFGGGYAAVEHLLAAGHTRIGYLQPAGTTPAIDGRLAAFRRAFEDHGVNFDSSLLATAETSDPAGGEETAATLLRRSRRPTALFCFNDRMALGAYRAARSAGLSIPAQLSIVGFDDVDFFTALLDPPLTTVRLPLYEMGRWAVEHLLAIQAGRVVPPVQHQMQCPLVSRASVGSPPSSEL